MWRAVETGGRWGRWLAAAALLVALVLLLVAALPWGLVARHADRPLAAVLGRSVEIGGARRIDWLSLTPSIAFTNVRIGQAEGDGRAPLAVIDHATLRVAALPLLIGQVRPRALELDGVRVHLVRDAQGRTNWRRPGKAGGGGGAPAIGRVTVRAMRVRLDDARRGLVLLARVSADATGVAVRGRGTLRGAPLGLALRAAPLDGGNAPWPARIALRSSRATIDAALRLDHPLDTGHFDARLAAAGPDLHAIDDIFEIGLFHTQPVRLTARLRHDAPAWRIAHLEARLGRTALEAALRVTRPQGRTRLEGEVTATTLDFDDFASDAQRARGAAEQARIGPRVVPDTRIVLARLHFDGVLRVRAHRLLGAPDSPFRSLAATATLDDRRLTLAPLAIGLPHGGITGRALVDHRGPSPRLALALRLAGGRVEDMLPHQQAVRGPLRAVLRVNGTGETVRAALARGTGLFGFAVEQGQIDRAYATFLGGDVLKGLGAAIGGGGAAAALPCLVGRFPIRAGLMTAQPLLVATGVSRGDGAGTIRLGPETLALRVQGRPVRPGLLLSTAPVRLTGTLSQPHLDIRPPRAEGAKKTGLLDRVGFFLKKLRLRGDAGAPPAAPVNCPAEATRALS
ncbi:AsmA family protein [Sphingomonas morindae]|uniref:AsmA family protein n=1 Tax=Sphingomonas morindae TaxID=1541170 RepID=A0ABY4XCQ1_9SPHN|nr:AsmA family protein [Sphingomonas morindae]USI74746.1 AsmA family protein [Sphingomonas morindae]